MGYVKAALCHVPHKVKNPVNSRVSREVTVTHHHFTVSKYQFKFLYFFNFYHPPIDNLIDFCYIATR